MFEHDLDNLKEVIDPTMLSNHWCPSPFMRNNRILAEKIQVFSCFQESDKSTGSNPTYVRDTVSSSVVQSYHPVVTDYLSVHKPKLTDARAYLAEGLNILIF